EQLWQLSQESVTTASVRTWLNQLRLDKAVRETVFNPGSSTIKQLRKALADAEIHATPQELVQWFRIQLSPPMSRVQGRQQPVEASPHRLAPATNTPPETVGQAEQPPGEAVDTAALLTALQHAVDARIPTTEWRTTSAYTAAAEEGRLFLVVGVRLRTRSLALGLDLPAETSNPRAVDDPRQFSWERFRRVVTVRALNDIDDELLALIAASREHTRSGRTTAYHHVSLKQLVDSGMLPAGTPLVFVGRDADLARAHISPAGEIVWQGNSYRSLSDRAFSALLGPGRASVNGWTQWYAELPSGRVQLAELRAKYLAGQASVDRRLEGAG
ncbi:MAG TPA: hypothetical protein VMU89_12270, partial [Thermomicrobiaceae bacterium]|nr:hypothetical protein [Thermomicrobiaceae bacterium]